MTIRSAQFMKENPDTGTADSTQPGDERLAGLVLIPAFATGLYYLLPAQLQDLLLVQMSPQLLAYAALGWWLSRNGRLPSRLGLQRPGAARGAAGGLAVGVALGLINAWVILVVIPRLGGDIAFLAETPHARVPPAAMLPWTIVAIAVLVEINFRGFQLGRWVTVFSRTPRPLARRLGPGAAVGLSALLFAFDPFMVATFRHLHWIAVWDGLVWGALRLGLGTVYATIAAHAVEVIILYSIVRSAFSQDAMPDTIP